MGNTPPKPQGEIDFGETTNVPSGTIKRGFNVYQHGNFTGLKKPEDVINRSNSECRGDGNSCDSNMYGKPIRNPTIKDIFRSDEKVNDGFHRDKCCVKLSWGRWVEDCGNCEFKGSHGGYDSDAKPGWISGFKVPVGMYLKASGESAEGRCGGPKTYVGWGYGSGGGDKKLPDDVAVGCSGGWDYGQNEWAKTTNDYKFKNVSNKDTKTNECWVGVSPPNYQDRIGCTQAGVYNPTFCQMGDYVVSTDRCQDYCKDLTIAPNKRGEGAKGNEYCRNALDRYCGTVPGEAYKRDAKGNLVKMGSGKYPLFDNEKCIEYCVGANTDNCHKIKRKVCTERLEDWVTNDKLVDYCKSYWFNNLDKPFMSNAYKKTLMDTASPQNIMSEKGLGRLCDAEGTNVDDMWCKEMKKAYCTANDANMLTDKCYEFCADPDNADQCDDYVKNMCRTRLNIEDEEGMLQSPPGSKNSYGSWCGCMMTDSFYRKARDEKLARFDELGYDIRGETDLSPECEYPYCKEGAIKTKSQQGRLTNDECKDCVQTMLTSLNNATFVNSDVQQASTSNCGKIIDRSKVPVLPPGVYNMKATDKKYRLDSDKTYCAYANEEDVQKDLEQHYNNLYKTIEEWPTSEYVERPNPCKPLPKPSAISRSSVLANITPLEDLPEEEQAGYGFLITFLSISFILLIVFGLVWAKKNKRGPFSDSSQFGRRRYRRSH